MILLGIDGNNYIHKAWFTIQGKEKMRPKKLSEIINHRVLSMICADAIHVMATHVCVAFDGSNGFRYKVYPPYKANRNPDDDGNGRSMDAGGLPRKEVYKYLPALIKYLKSAGIPVVQLDEYEADDVLACLATLPTTVYLGTRDKDMYQCLRPNVKMIYSETINKERKYFYIGVQEAEDRMGVRIDQMVELQMLIGDSIDNIPQAKERMGVKTAAKILATHGTIKDYYKAAKPKDKEWLIVAQKQLKVNRRLVTMVDTVYRPKPSELVVKAQPGDWPDAYHQLTARTSRAFTSQRMGSLRNLTKRRF